MKRNPHSFEEEIFRKILRDLRLKKKLRQVDLAGKLNAPQQFVSKYESGERTLTFTETVTICIVLGVSPVSFLKEYLRLYKEHRK